MCVSQSLLHGSICARARRHSHLQAEREMYWARGLRDHGSARCTHDSLPANLVDYCVVFLSFINRWVCTSRMRFIHCQSILRTGCTSASFQCWVKLTLFVSKKEKNINKYCIWFVLSLWDSSVCCFSTDALLYTREKGFRRCLVQGGLGKAHWLTIYFSSLNDVSEFCRYCALVNRNNNKAALRKGYKFHREAGGQWVHLLCCGNARAWL